MDIKAAELTGLALDFFVNACIGGKWDSVDSFAAYHEDGDFNYSTNWAQGGPIIEQGKINLYSDLATDVYAAAIWRAVPSGGECLASIKDCPTPLIAAMRCYVASKLGDEVEVPDELT